jgi:hypothetical protein
MSNTNLAAFHFSTLLGYKAHQIANQLAAKIREIDSDPEKAKLVYLLVLARAVGEMYFRTRGFKVKAVDFSQWDARNKSIYEICCLEIEGYGRVLLIPCGALVESVSLPREAQENILAYMIVELDSEVEPLEEIEEGTILGFVREFQPKIALENLEDLETLPNYISSLEQKQDWFSALIQRTREKASQLGDIASESIDSLAGQVRGAVALCSVNLAGIQSQSSQCDDGEVPIIIQLGYSTTQLTLDFRRVNETKFSIQANLIAIGNNTFLPPNLTLTIKDAKGSTWDSVCAEDAENSVTLERIHIDSTSYCTLELSLDQNIKTLKIE